MQAIPSLRISLTDACNLRCVYCHAEGMREVRRCRRLLPGDVELIVRTGTAFGVRRVKLTGGEPLLRWDIVRVVERLAGIRELASLSMTTNGVLLGEMAGELVRAGLRRVNVSLDTLRERTYASLTGGGMLWRVVEGIDEALARGMEVELNTVVMRGINLEELPGIIEFASRRGCSLQLIELVEPAHNPAFYRRHHVGLEVVECMLASMGERVAGRRSPHDRPVYMVDGVRVSLCTRVSTSSGCTGMRCRGLRVTADGFLRGFRYSDSRRVEIPGDGERGVRRAFERAVELLLD